MAHQRGFISSLLLAAAIVAGLAYFNIDLRGILHRLSADQWIAHAWMVTVVLWNQYCLPAFIWMRHILKI